MEKFKIRSIQIQYLNVLKNYEIPYPITIRHY